MRYFFGAIIASVALTSPALSQGRAELRIGLDDISVDDSEATISGSGVSYGAEVGYDFQVGEKIFLGPYASFDLSNFEKATDENDPENDFITFKHGLSIGARAGADVGVARIFAKAGYSSGTLRVVNDDSGVFDEKFGFDGFQVGGGIEVDLNERLFIKAEVDYSMYSRDQFDTLSITEEREVEIDRLQILAGVGFRI